MNRREFLGTAAAGAAAVGAAGVLMTSNIAQAKGKFNLRYAVNLGWMSKDWSIEQRLDYVAENGFDAVEWNPLMSQMTLKEAENYRKMIDARGIEHGIFVVNREGLGQEIQSPEWQGKFLEDVRKARQYSDIIGNKSATIVAGPELYKVSRWVQLQKIIDLYKRAGDELAGSHLTLVLEPLNLLVNHPGYLVAESGEAWLMMKSIGNPHIKILFDMYHQQITEGNLVNNIRDYYDEIGYFQIGDNPGRQEPGTGEVNWKHPFKAIYDLGYKGLLGMEHGLSGGNSKAGIDKCFDTYREFDKFL
jgi:hydroxypyruvate isomerase